MPPKPLIDPETLLIIALIGGALGAITAVGTFILYDMAGRLGPRIESPAPIAAFQTALEATIR